MNTLYTEIQSQLNYFYEYAGDEMLEMDKEDLLKHIVEELFFEIDVRDHSFNDIFVALTAGMNSVFDDYCYSGCKISKALTPVYLEQIKNLTEI